VGDIKDVRALAEALGVGHLSDEQIQGLLPEAASIIQDTMSQLINLMRARSAVKNELRVAQTMIQTNDNNPLKFSVTPRDAMLVMFSGATNAYMSPREAVQDAFDDLSDHQLAVFSGMRAAYEFMLQQFSPRSLESRMNTSDSLLNLNKGAKKWDAYEKHYEALTRDPEQSYRRLFGEEFANGLEACMLCIYGPESRRN